MPFIVPFIPAIISAGAAIGSSLLSKGGSSNSGFGGSSNPLDSQISGLLDKQGNRSRKLFKQGRQDWKDFRGSIGPVRDYFSTLLGGDRNALSELLGPEIGTIHSGYDAVKKTISEFSPRGGGRTSQLSQLPEREAGDITNLFLKARPMAAQGLQGVAGLLGNQALGEQTGANSSLSSSLSALLGLRQQDLEKFLSNRQFGSGIGSSLGALLSQLLSRFNNGDSGGGLSSLSQTLLDGAPDTFDGISIPG